jgi:hypothetical protein
MTMTITEYVLRSKNKQNETTRVWVGDLPSLAF